MIDYPIEIGGTALKKLQEFLQKSSYSQILVIVDENTQTACLPVLSPFLPEHQVCQIPSGEIHKTLRTCEKIWQVMTDYQFDRKALVINLGGGVIGDMGGFVAQTYKRGIDFVQVPTTLLSQVDASVGGKLGIDFGPFKNHIGLFAEPQGVYIYPGFLKTLSKRELLSGFAEVIKHHLIADRNGWHKLIGIESIDSVNFEEIIAHSVAIKSRIVEADPFEGGLRKALNFGHTVGHAVESYYLHTEEPFLHGEAIALGMIAEAWISHQRNLLSEKELEQIHSLIPRLYGKRKIPSDKLESIASLALNDKKNTGKQIQCTLLDSIGEIAINQPITKQEIMDSLHYT